MSTVPSGASPATASGPTLTELEQSVSRIRIVAAASWRESLIRLLMALAPSDNPFRCSALRTVPVRLTLLWQFFRFHRYRLRFAFPIRNLYPTEIPQKVPLNCQSSAKGITSTSFTGLHGHPTVSNTWTLQSGDA